MRREFRNFKISRTCTKEYKTYASYKPHLKKDFHSRCAYCNLLDNQITTSFEVDHLIPREVFKDVWPELGTNYKNLVYSCKKCNVAKSSKYKGKISKRTIENELFYDPEEVDYNKIFYRNDIGSICSDDEKGRKMIDDLKLYRRIHNLAWLCEFANNTLERLNQQIISEGVGSEKGKILSEAKLELSDYYNNCRDVFLANYNNEKFSID